MNGTRAPSVSAPTPTRSGSLVDGLLHEVDARAHVLDARDGGDDRELPVGSRPLEQAPVEHGARRGRRAPASSSSYASTSASCFCAVAGRSSRWIAAREPSMAVATASSALRLALERARRPPRGRPRRRRRWPRRRPTRRARARSCGRPSARAATFTLALPMSMPSQVGMSSPFVLLSHSMLK